MLRPADLSDADSLVEAARHGDQAAFAQLVRLTYPDALTLAVRLTGSLDDARDVVQEAYLRAYRGMRRFRGDSAFTTWLYRIVANCSSTHHGRGRRHRHDELSDDLVLYDAGPGADPHGRAEIAELRSDLEVLLRDLPASLRVVVVLRDIYDLTHAEIAAELGISVTAAKVRLHRARRRLAEQLAERAGFEEVRAHAG